MIQERQRRVRGSSKIHHLEATRLDIHVNKLTLNVLSRSCDDKRDRIKL